MSLGGTARPALKPVDRDSPLTMIYERGCVARTGEYWYDS